MKGVISLGIILSVSSKGFGRLNNVEMAISMESRSKGGGSL
jgi:hypothetical protein